MQKAINGRSIDPVASPLRRGSILGRDVSSNWPVAKGLPSRQTGYLSLNYYAHRRKRLEQAQSLSNQTRNHIMRTIYSTLTNKRFLAAGLIVCGIVAFSPNARPQGCVAARGAGMPCGVLGHPEIGLTETLPPTSGFQGSVAYRWLHSGRHFIGDVEQTRRETEGSQVINDSHFTDISLSYAFSPRLSATVTLPFAMHDRSQTLSFTNATGQTIGRQRYATQSSGIGDVRVVVDAWMLDPVKPRKGNLLLGLGFSAPTGEKDATDVFEVRGANNTVLAQQKTVDQSIQPGTGGWGVIIELYGYRQIIPRLNGYINGAYTITPEEKNGVPTFRSNPFEATMSITDSYLGRAGFEYLLWPKYGLTFSLGGRVEGVPVRDVVGGSEGFRRPGYAVSIEPGVSAMFKSWSLSLYTPVAVYRNREPSVADLEQANATGKFNPGDAAFADFLVMFNLTKRF
jgi:hypothetical protein